LITETFLNDAAWGILCKVGPYTVLRGRGTSLQARTMDRFAVISPNAANFRVIFLPIVHQFA
jgi:hypothetical protein